MDDNGRLTDVLIEDEYITDPATGIRSWFEFHVWADAGMKEIILSVPGVLTAYDHLYPNRYEVFVDPRYDREWVRAEIEARIKIGVQ